MFPDNDGRTVLITLAVELRLRAELDVDISLVADFSRDDKSVDMEVLLLARDEATVLTSLETIGLLDEKLEVYALRLVGEVDDGTGEPGVTSVDVTDGTTDELESTTVSDELAFVVATGLKVRSGVGVGSGIGVEVDGATGETGQLAS